MIKEAENTVVTEEFVPREKYDKLLAEHEYLKQQLAELRRLVFGSKRERFVPSGTPGAEHFLCSIQRKKKPLRRPRR